MRVPTKHHFYMTKKPGSFDIWMAQIRARFLLLAVFLVLIGLAVAYKYKAGDTAFRWLDAILLVAGVVSAHISVNLFNEYSDFRTRIDFSTPRTPFSGGTKMMVDGLVKPQQVKFAAIMTLVIALVIGGYFSVRSHWIIALFSLIGAFTIVFYTDFLARHMLGELFCGITLGSFVVAGTYAAMNGTPGETLIKLVPAEVWLLSIPPGILTSLLLFLNEFPDAEADREGGRRHLVIRFGFRKSAIIYMAGMVLCFGTIILMPLLGFSSYWIYISLLPLPLAVRASMIALRYDGDVQHIIPALVSNVMTVLGVDLLLALGTIAGIWVKGAVM